MRVVPRQQLTTVPPRKPITTAATTLSVVPTLPNPSPNASPIAPTLPENVVTLNIGGTIFQTYSDTLVGSGLPHLSEVAKFAFFDRDPTAFHAILNALRQHRFPIRPRSLTIEEWEEELRFWGINAPVARLPLYLVYLLKWSPIVAVFGLLIAILLRIRKCY